MITVITFEDCLALYNRHIQPGYPVRPELLKSAIAAPFQTFEGKDLYPTVIEKAARLGFGIAQAQAFIDGNKRLAFIAMLTFLTSHGYELFCTDKEVVAQFTAIATREIDAHQFARWLQRKTVYTG